MSIETAAPAPVETVAAPAVETAAPQEQPAAPTAAEARQNLRDRARGRTNVAQQVNRTVDQPRDEIGRFAATTTEVPATETVSTDNAATDTASATAASQNAPAAKERIELHPDHPLRARGRQFVDELTPDELRGLVNTPIKSRELETTREELARLRAELARATAAQGGYQEQLTQLLSQPEIAKRSEELKQWDAENGTNEHARWLRGLRAEIEESVGQAVSKQTQEHEATAAVTSFFQSAQTKALGYMGDPSLRGEIDSAFSEAWEHYASAMDMREQRGMPAELNEQEFLSGYFEMALLRRPAVQNAVRQYQAQRDARARQDAAKAARDAAAKEEADRLAALQQKRSQNGIGRLPSNANTGQQLPVNPVPSAAQLRQNVKARVRGLTQR